VKGIPKFHQNLSKDYENQQVSEVMSNKLLLALNFYTSQSVVALCQEIIQRVELQNNTTEFVQ
jgi:hypothetical protein